MKKLIVLIGIAFCLATYSLPLCAEKDKNTEEKNITLIVDGDTIDCSQTLLDKYGSEKIVQAYKKEKIMCDSIVVIKDVIPMKERTVIYLSLIKEGDKVTEFVSSPITTSEVNWLAISCLSGVFIFVIILYICYARLYLPSKG